MSTWETKLRFMPAQVMLLVTEDGDDLLKARLPTSLSLPGHPRALLTLLEGLALWAGQPLSVVISVDGGAEITVDATLYGGGVWPPESPLVCFEASLRSERPFRLSGLGDFRQLRLL